MGECHLLCPCTAKRNNSFAKATTLVTNIAATFYGNWPHVEIICFPNRTEILRTALFSGGLDTVVYRRGRGCTDISYFHVDTRVQLVTWELPLPLHLSRLESL